MRKDVEEYLIKYPLLRKWINECSLCHEVGYKPSMMEEIYPHPPEIVNNLRYYFKPLKINKDGYCEECGKRLQEEILNEASSNDK